VGPAAVLLPDEPAGAAEAPEVVLDLSRREVELPHECPEVDARMALDVVPDGGPRLAHADHPALWCPPMGGRRGAPGLVGSVSPRSER